MNADRISVTKLAKVGSEVYSRPPELIAKLCLEVIAQRSTRGTTTMADVEKLAYVYMSENPKSTISIHMFLEWLRREVE